MKTNELLEMDLKRNPLMTIDESLDQHLNDEIPQDKIDSVEDAIHNTNLLEILKKYKVGE